MNEQDKILMIKYLEGSLDKEEQRQFDEKMVQDVEFRAEVTTLGQTENQLKEFLTTRKQQFRRSLHTAAKNERKARKIKQWIGIAIATLLLVLLGWWGADKLRQSSNNTMNIDGSLKTQQVLHSVFMPAESDLSQNKYHTTSSQRGKVAASSEVRRVNY